MSDQIVLDSWAILSLLADEPEAEQVESAIDEHECVISWINLAEVEYIVARRRGPKEASQAIADLRVCVQPLLPDEELFHTAASIKSRMPMAFADAFAAATACKLDAPLMTGDPELMRRPPGALKLRPWKWIDLRT